MGGPREENTVWHRVLIERNSRSGQTEVISIEVG